MREPADCFIKYCGYTQPESADELEFEILGLRQAVKTIETRIALLEQSRFIAKVAINKNASSIGDMFEANNESNFNQNSKKEGNKKED